MKLDILAFAAHPDDTELSCSGTLATHAALGKAVGVIDITEGEMGTRGTVQLRREEAAAAAKIVGLNARENIGLPDALFRINEENLRAVVRRIRKYQPEIVLANAVHDRHPDHPKASELLTEACFLAGLRKFETLDDEGNAQGAWRPKAVYHYVQSLYVKPDFVVDISAHWTTKLEAIKAFKSQFFNPGNNEPETFISTKGFLDLVEARAREFGYVAGVEYAEGFTVERYPAVKNLFDLI